MCSSLKKASGSGYMPPKIEGRNEPVQIEADMIGPMIGSLIKGWIGITRLLVETAGWLEIDEDVLKSPAARTGSLLFELACGGTENVSKALWYGPWAWSEVCRHPRHLMERYCGVRPPAMKMLPQNCGLPYLSICQCIECENTNCSGVFEVIKIWEMVNGI